MEQYLQQTNNEEVKNWINSNLKNYLKKNQENMGEIEHIIDYLNSDKASKRLRKMSYSQANEAAKKWVKSLIKKGNKIKETDDDVETVLYLDNGFTLKKLKSENSYKREGALMAHCVGSYHGRNCTIYSLRDSDNKPHCTIEVNNTDVNQIKGKGNGEIHPKYIQYIFTILDYLGKPIRKSEFSYLGYEEISLEFSDLASMLYDNAGKFILEYDNSLFWYVRASKAGLKGSIYEFIPFISTK
jgi:hypothetical protein